MAQSPIVRRLCLCVAILVLATGCQTSDYQRYEGLGSVGYRENEVRPDTWTITYVVDNYATQDTLKAYWFYRAAELTLADGYQGFSIGPGYPITVATVNEPGVQVASTIYVPIIIPIHPPPRMQMEFGTIELLHPPFDSTPGRHIFDAEVLRAKLAGAVHGPKCNRNNVCPYDHALLAQP